MDDQRISKLLAYVLRHRPEEIGLRLDAQGWVAVDELLAALREHKGLELAPERLQRIVAADAKGRYSLANGRIRANQGHSVEAVDAIDPTPQVPPARLFHGTTRERWALIQQSGGLQKMARHHVHLSADEGTARQVGARHRRETAMLLAIDAAAMSADGHAFWRSANGVWLAETVPLRYLSEVERR